MKTLLTRSTAKTISMPNRVRRINIALAESQKLLRPLELQDMQINCLFLHIGPGIYKKDHNPGIHSHSKLQLEYILDGQFSFDIEGKKVTLSPGDGIFIAPDTRHTWSCRNTGAMIGVLVEISGYGYGEFIRRLQKINNNKETYFHSNESAELASKLLRQLTCQARDLWHIREISMIMELWFLSCVRTQLNLLKWKLASPSKTITPQEHSKNIADKIMEFLRHNYMHSIDLKDIAFHVSITTRHANRIFQQHYCDTINKALLRIRLDSAMKMLQQSQETPIKTIAYDAGFKSSSYFAKCFCQAFGISPKNIQQQKTHIQPPKTTKVKSRNKNHKKSSSELSK